MNSISKDRKRFSIGSRFDFSRKETRRARRLSVLCAAVAAACLVGCGGSGNSKPAPLTPAGEVQDGVNTLDAALSSPTNRLADFKTANQYFADVLQSKASTAAELQQAQIGYVITASALVANAFTSDFGTGFLNSTQGIPVKRAVGLLSPFTSQPFASPTISRVSDVFPVTWALSAFSGSAGRGTGLTAAQVTTDLQNVNSYITNALPYLTNSRILTLDANPMTLTYVNSVGATTTIKVGYVEALSLRVALNSIRGLVDLAQVYTFDPGTFNFNSDALSGLTNRTGTLAPSAILPTGAFATLNANSPALLSDFVSAWTTAANDLATTVTAYNARGSESGWLLGQFNITSGDLSSAISYATVVPKFLTKPQPFLLTMADGTKVGTTLNIAAWTSNPPSDLRAEMATLQSNGTTVTPVSGSITDLTFGGLFLGGLPSANVYDRSASAAAPFTYANADALSGIFFSLDSF